MAGPLMNRTLWISTKRCTDAHCTGTFFICEQRKWICLWQEAKMDGCFQFPISRTSHIHRLIIAVNASNMCLQKLINWLRTDSQPFRHRKPYIITLASLRLLQGCYPVVHIPVSLRIPCISSVCVTKIKLVAGHSHRLTEKNMKQGFKKTQANDKTWEQVLSFVSTDKTLKQTLEM